MERKAVIRATTHRRNTRKNHPGKPTLVVHGTGDGYDLHTRKYIGQFAGFDLKSRRKARKAAKKWVEHGESFNPRVRKLFKYSKEYKICGITHFKALLPPSKCGKGRTIRWGRYKTAQEAHEAALRYITTGEREKVTAGLPEGKWLVIMDASGKRRATLDPEEIKAELERRKGVKRVWASRPGRCRRAPRAPKICADVPRTVQGPPKLRVKPRMLNGGQVEEIKERLAAQKKRGPGITSDFITVRSEHADLVQQHLAQKGVAAKIVVEGNFLRLRIA